MGVGDLAAIADIIHAVIEFVAYARVLVEPIDQFGQLPGNRAILDFHLRQALDQIEPRTRCVEGGEHDSGGCLIGLEKDHEQIDKKALVVLPAEYEIADQGQN